MEKEVRANAKHLTHKYASFHGGCTLNEMFLIMGIYIAVEIPVALIIAGFIAPYVGGYFGAFLLLMLLFFVLTFFVLIKATAKKIAKIRDGKSPGFLTLKLNLFMNKTLGFKIPYVTPKGSWSTRRTAK